MTRVCLVDEVWYYYANSKNIPANSIILTPSTSMIFRVFSPRKLLLRRNAVPNAAVTAMVRPIPKLITSALSAPSIYIPIEIVNKNTTIVPGHGTIPAPRMSIKSVEFEVVLQL